MLRGSSAAEKSRTASTQIPILSALVPCLLLAGLSGCGGSNPAPLLITTPDQTLLVSDSLQIQITGKKSRKVTWSMNDTPGGTAEWGTITPDGQCHAPPIPPSPNLVTIRVVNARDTEIFDSVALVIVNPAPAIASVTPSSTITGSLDALVTVSGEGFAAQSEVMVGPH